MSAIRSRARLVSTRETLTGRNGLPKLTLKSQSLGTCCSLSNRAVAKVREATSRWLRRYLGEGSPPLQHFAAVAADVGRRGSTTPTPAVHGPSDDPLVVWRLRSRDRCDPEDDLRLRVPRLRDGCPAGRRSRCCGRHRCDVLPR